MHGWSSNNEPMPVWFDLHHRLIARPGRRKMHRLIYQTPTCLTAGLAIRQKFNW